MIFHSSQSKENTVNRTQNDGGIQRKKNWKFPSMKQHAATICSQRSRVDLIDLTFNRQSNRELHRWGTRLRREPNRLTGVELLKVTVYRWYAIQMESKRIDLFRDWFCQSCRISHIHVISMSRWTRAFSNAKRSFSFEWKLIKLRKSFGCVTGFLWLWSRFLVE